VWKKQLADQASAYVHWSKLTEGQLQTYAEHMSREWFTHKQVEACVSAPTQLPTTSTPATTPASTHAQAVTGGFILDLGRISKVRWFWKGKPESGWLYFPISFVC